MRDAGFLCVVFSLLVPTISYISRVSVRVTPGALCAVRNFKRNEISRNFTKFQDPIPDFIESLHAYSRAHSYGKRQLNPSMYIRR